MHSFFVAPSNFDVIVVTGQDALRFLQGQLTCDVAVVEERGFCNGAVCNNKGRVIAAFTLIRWQDSYYLCMSAGLGALFTAALKKFLPFYKCSMESSSQALYALAGNGVKAALSAAGLAENASPPSRVLAFPDGWLCMLDAGFSRAFLLTTRSSPQMQSVLQSCPEATLEEWEALSMLAGHYPFRPSDTEQFTPQELHFDRNGYVSFSKGCYTGQEIVARMHYRGKLKKQLYLLTVEPGKPSDTEGAAFGIYDAAGTELGHSLVSRTLGQETFALAQLPSDLSEKLFIEHDHAVQHRVFARAEPEFRAAADI